MPDQEEQSDNETDRSLKEELLHEDCVFVTRGPFAGRIGYSDDDEFFFIDGLGEVLDLYDESDLVLEPLQLSEDELFEIESDLGNVDGSSSSDQEMGTWCSKVCFGLWLERWEDHIIPHSCLRPASMHDLVDRLSRISDELSDAAFGKLNLSVAKKADILFEQILILNEMRWRELSTMRKNLSENNIFLCHSKVDVAVVRKLYQDLTRAGQKPWMDEFEISIGDSIVDAIDAAASTSRVFIFCMSPSALQSAWAKREWQSTLMRKLRDDNILFLPVLVDECEPPGLLADLRYANIAQDYNSGLRDILDAIAKDRPKEPNSP